MKKMFAAVAALAMLVAQHKVVAEPFAEGFVTFEPVSNPLDLESMNPNPFGYSFPGSVGDVYFHHRIFTLTGTNFRINTLKFAHDNDGDGVYSGWIDVSGVSTPGSGNPGYYLVKDGVVLNPAVIRNQVVDQVIITNHNFLGRSFHGATKWRLETDYGVTISETMHGMINHPEPIVAQDGSGELIGVVKFQPYCGQMAMTVRSPEGWKIWASTDLDDWHPFADVEEHPVQIFPRIISKGGPRSFFWAGPSDWTPPGYVAPPPG